MIIYTVKDNADRAKQAVLFLWATAFVFALLTLSTLLFPTDTEDDVVTIGQGVVAFTLIGLSITAAVYFLCWFRRAYANLKRAGRRTEHTDGWAVGAWFVPFLNLFRPYTIMKEIWNGTHQLAYHYQPPHPLLRWWWIVSVLTSGLARLTTTSSRHAEATQQLDTVNLLDTIHSIFVLLFIALTIACINRIAAAEEQLLLRQQVDAIGGPAPEPLPYYPDEETLAY